MLALASVTGGRIAVLTSQNRIYLVDPKAPERPDVFAARMGPNQAADVVWYPGGAAGAAGQLFVTMNMREFRARLARYDLAGKLTGEWFLNSGGDNDGNLQAWSSTAVEADGRTGYVVNWRRTEVYRLNLAVTRSVPALLVSVRDAETLSPVVLDASRRRLLVADPFKGHLFEVKLDKPRATRLMEDLGEPNALAMDAASDRLFIADAAGGRILVADLALASPHARVFLANPRLREPHGMTLAPDGTLWAADYRSPTLFQISPAGSVLRTVRIRLE